ncbi:MFS general substrate transporter [Martensiomyces pterosporus]|nr:MFS general substrate transporter [Martensiomyces pterosporus]
MGSSLMSPLKSTLKHELGINNTQWASLISMVWVVSTITPFVAGLVIDIMGAPLAGAISLLLILAGNGICGIAVATRQLGVFLVGRAIYSLGGGAVLLVGEVIMLKWFKGRSLPIAFGCASTIGGIMSFSGPATVTAILSKNAKVAIPFWLATGLSAFGLLCFGFYAIIHYSHYAQDIEAFDGGKCGSDDGGSLAKVMSIGESPYGVEQSGKAAAATAAAIGDADTKNMSETSEKPLVRIYSGTDKSSTHPAEGTNLVAPPTDTATPAAASRGLLGRLWAKLRWLFFGLAALPESYWHVLLCISVQGTLFIPLHEIIPEMMETEWSYSRAEASRLFVYLHIIPIVLHISLGIFINRFGHRINIFFVGSVLIFVASVFTTFVRRIPILLSLILMNLSGSFVPASIFSLMNIVIDNGEIAGAALGLIRSAEFASVTLMEMLDGLLQDADHNRYDTVLVGLVVFAGILLVVAFVSLVVDYTVNGGIMNSANPYSKLKPICPFQADTGSKAGAEKFGERDSESQTQESLAPTASIPIDIPKRRYYYIGTIGVLLVAAWGLFILSLSRM